MNARHLTGRRDMRDSGLILSAIDMERAALRAMQGRGHVEAIEAEAEAARRARLPFNPRAVAL